MNKVYVNKILFIARRYPPSVGGMERFAYDLANSLSKSVDITTITWGGSNKWLPLVLPGFFIRGAWQLYRHKDIDIIHMQDALQAPVGWLLHVIFRKPYVIVAHGLDITYQSLLYQTVVLPFVRRADAVISISTATKDEAETKGVSVNKSHVITLGAYDDYSADVLANKELLSDRISAPLSGRQLLLTTGRLVKRKGVAWFISTALPRLVEHNKRILYLVAGDGVAKDSITKVIHDNGMQDNVIMLGRVTDEVRSLLYRSSDIFVMPNIIVPGDMEGFGIVAHEAAVAGLPVVASDLEGIADALHHKKNGILVRTQDDEAFVDEISKLLNDDKYRQDFGMKARKYTLDTYSWNSIAEQYVSVYAHLIK